MASSRRLLHYQQQQYKDIGGPADAILSKVGLSLILWLLGFASVLLLVTIYSPNPFGAPPMPVAGSFDSQATSGETVQINSPGAGGEELCDLSVGRWVRDTRGPQYTNWSCPTIPESKRCDKYGKDMDYVNWRWKPDRCDLPRFDPRTFLHLVRGKTMAFVGDSVARNQYESLLCFLSQAETPSDVYRDSEDRTRTWHFPSHNFTLMILWTRFLVAEKEVAINGSVTTGVFDLHMDKIDNNWSEKLRVGKIDILIISDGHWFFRKLYLYERGNLLGCVFCSEPNTTSLTISYAIQKVFRSIVQFINNVDYPNSRGLLTIVRTFSPAHFENGSWDNGGYCNRTQPIMRKEEVANIGDLDISKGQMEEVDGVNESILKKGNGKKFEVLDVTEMMLMRGDGHPGSHWNNEWMKGYNDCVHWCLPGPIDTWNEILLEKIKKHR